ncbi:hypothetical protein [Alkalicoccus luteus]|uniref:Uncharacterized protein n=1 Tax=Alkalicoccus luteus TaxID=1237094 RepID=A0A969TUP7_9BACI|nr:hypothetical protein [Alkalicoccus luteus]NJP38933.1 hypothetical protein [Alkalicoccus luteus]
MKLTEEQLPEKERPVWRKLQQLENREKQTLWLLIQHSSKDHLCIVQHITPAVQALEQHGLIQANPAYQGKTGISFYVLRNTPHLMKKLQSAAIRQERPL